MSDLPTFLRQGERARLFPILADTSKEGRSLSIFLSCFQAVEEFGKSLLGTIDQRSGARTRIETFTEVVFAEQNEKSLRPDGLIVVRNGNSQWTALVEAKVGSSELTSEQVTGYMELARLNKIDALVTISNQFASLPTHHPIAVSASLRKKVQLYHWSWMSILTEAALLIGNAEVKDRDQHLILHEMQRFLSHASAGVRGFDQMPQAWTDLVATISAGGRPAASGLEARAVVGAWHQEIGDLTLLLSRQIGASVETRIARAHVGDPAARQKSDLDLLVKSGHLAVSLAVPNAASPIDVCADLAKRTVTFSMRVKAPQDRQSAKARTNWLLKQLAASDPNGIHIRMSWPGKTPDSQFSLLQLRENPDLGSVNREGQSLLSFEVLFMLDTGARFAQRRNFVTDLEAALPRFYENVSEKLRSWQPTAPKLQQGKSTPESVSPQSIQEEVERVAIESVPQG